MPLHNIALVGANGTLGPAVLSALIASPNLTVTIISRQSSKSAYPQSVNVVTVPDGLPAKDLATALRGQDALVITIAGSYVEEQKRLIEAAYYAGVRRIIPAEFGSCDSADDETVKLLPLMEGKKQVREYLQTWAAKPRLDEFGGGKLAWTALVTGHFFDYGLKGDLLLFDVRNRRARLVDGGDIAFSATTLTKIGEAVVKILTEREAETENKLLYIQSFCVTQKEVLASLERTMGGKWDVEVHDNGKLLAEARPKMLEGDREALEEVVAVQGIVAADWRGREGFANGILGLQEENLDEVVKRAVEAVEGK